MDLELIVKLAAIIAAIGAAALSGVLTVVALSLKKKLDLQVEHSKRRQDLYLSAWKDLQILWKEAHELPNFTYESVKSNPGNYVLEVEKIRAIAVRCQHAVPPAFEGRFTRFVSDLLTTVQRFENEWEDTNDHEDHSIQDEASYRHWALLCLQLKGELLQEINDTISLQKVAVDRNW